VLLLPALREGEGGAELDGVMEGVPAMEARGLSELTSSSWELDGEGDAVEDAAATEACALCSRAIRRKSVGLRSRACDVGFDC
jgi:hypothetical protein